MTTTATHHEHGPTTERVLFLAFDCAKKPGSSAAPRVLVNSRASALSQRDIRRVCSKK